MSYFPIITVMASYQTSGTQALNNNVTSSINFDTKIYDSNLAVTVAAGGYTASTGSYATNNWKFTAPFSGTYLISTSLLTTSGTWNDLTRIFGHLYKNGSFQGTSIVSQYTQSTAPWLASISGAMQIRLLAGEYIELRVSQNSGSNTALIGGLPEVNRIEITRIGNY